MNDAVLLIGVGNEYRSDDGLGIYAVREIRRRRIPGVVVMEQGGEGAELMDAWQGYDRVIIVDALRSAAGSGDVHRIDATAGQIPANLVHYSSHSFGVMEAIEMSRLLNRLPGTLVLFGIEGKQFDVGPGLTDEVLRNMPLMLSSIEEEVHRIHSQLLEAEP